MVGSKRFRSKVNYNILYVEKKELRTLGETRSMAIGENLQGEITRSIPEVEDLQGEITWSIPEAEDLQGEIKSQYLQTRTSGENGWNVGTR